MSSSDRTRAVEQALARRVQNAFPSLTEAAARLAGEEKLSFYLGIDPTGALHLGHVIPLLFLDDLRKAGHTIIILFGDFTARIGDPTGKGAARKALTEAEVKEHMRLYQEQITRVLPEGSFTVAYNSEWLASMTMEQVILLARSVTVQQMLARDMFQERLKHDKPIHVSEFLYPLMQGYDSVALRVDGEVGGNDQTFNMLVGREFEREQLGKDKLVLATQLLVDPATGKKMSKTEGTFIALSDTPQEMRRKVLAMDDAMTAITFTLCTRRDEEWIKENAKHMDPRSYKEELAAELIRMFHGQEAVSSATAAEEIQAKGTILQTLQVSGVIPSMSVGKNLIKERAVKVNGELIETWDISVQPGDTIQIGKGKFVKVK